MSTAHASEIANALPLHEEALLFLVAAVLCVLILHRLRISPVLGYLAAGLVLGPTGFGIASTGASLRAMAEFGVIFLLFLIGLELSAERLRAMRRWVFGLGAAQMLVTMGALAIPALAFGVPTGTAVLLAGAFALSSTAMAVQLLIERGEAASMTGRVSFAVLLLQDLAVAPLLLLASILSEPQPHALWESIALAIGKAGFAVAAIVALGRLTFGPLLRLAAKTRSTEIFTATALLIVLGTGWATGASGLSAALGAFLAGLALAGTEFRHQAETDIQPFKGLLLGLFFFSVGLEINLGALAETWPLIVAATLALMLVKALLLAAFAGLFGTGVRVAWRVGLLLAQTGEFAFVLVAAALAGGLIAPKLAQELTAVAGLSLALTPFLPMLADRLLPREIKGSQPPSLPAATDFRADLDAGGHVIIAGFGRVGRTVASLMERQQVPYVALDSNPDLVAAERLRGRAIHYGDSVKPEIFKQLHVEKAAAVILTIDQPEAAARAMTVLREHWPHVRVLARARDQRDAHRLLQMGAVTVTPETFESSLALAKGALEALGVPSAAADDLVALYREGDHAEARTQEQTHGD
jgi:monovalent cation:H+ antiporter-2, CPA2 family